MDKLYLRSRVDFHVGPFLKVFLKGDDDGATQYIACQRVQTIRKVDSHWLVHDMDGSIFRVCEEDNGKVERLIEGIENSILVEILDELKKLNTK